MKKFFAIFAVVCLFAATNIFADTSEGTGTGSYGATIYCVVDVTGGAPNVALGSFFAKSTAQTVTASVASQVWDVWGPNNATAIAYSYDLNGTTASGAAPIAGTGANNVLNGTVTFPTVQPDNCSAPTQGASSNAQVTFVPSDVVVPTPVASETFLLTLTVTATI